MLPTLLKATWVREGYRDEAQEREVFQRALGWLESYVETLDPAAEPLGVERVIGAKTSVLALNGRADRIDSRIGPDGPEAVIVDYKTGRAGVGPDDARGSRALALYAYAAQRVFRRPCRRVELHHLPTGTIAAHEHTERVDRPAGAAEPSRPRRTSWPLSARSPPEPTRSRRSRPGPGPGVPGVTTAGCARPAPTLQSVSRGPPSRPLPSPRSGRDQALSTTSAARGQETTRAAPEVVRRARRA